MLQIINPAVVGGSLALVVFFGILVSLAIGRRIGQRALARQSDAGLASAGSLETAVFALLGLLIAFTFSGALTRFDVRRGQVVDEANAIGTAYLRIDLLPPSAQPRLRETFKTYVDSRIVTYQKLPDLQAAQQELARSQALQADIWAQAVAATRLPESRAGNRRAADAGAQPDVRHHDRAPDGHPDASADHHLRDAGRPSRSPRRCSPATRARPRRPTTGCTSSASPASSPSPSS